MSDLDIQSRKESTSNASVDHGNEVVLHDSSKTCIVAVPFYVKHNSGFDELTIRITTYQKSPSSPSRVMLSNEKSVSLDSAATDKLFDFLRTSRALIGRDVGDYLLVRLSNGDVDYRDTPPDAVVKALMSALENPDIAEHLSKVELTDEFVSAIRNSIHLSEMKRAIMNLRDLLDSGEDKERYYQEWCFENSWAFGSAYVVRDSERAISNSDNVDMLLPLAASGYRDIVELKSPKFHILQYDSSHRNYYFSSETSKAIGQCHRYLDVFSDEAENGLRDHREIIAYCPRAIIVIGRSNTWTPEHAKALHGLNSRLSSIQVMSYDHLLAQCERMLAVLSSETNDLTAS